MQPVAPHDACLAYLEHVADRFDLRRDIRFGTRVERTVFDEDGGRWAVRTDRGDEVVASFVVSAVGCLSTANVPDIPGLDEFGGDWYHTGQWPHEGVEFAGKRVGLIGTGSTGIQAAPVIAGEAEHLYVFQRTPNYSVPARNAPMSPARDAEIESHYSDVRDHARRSFGGFPYDPSSRSALEVSPRSGRRCTRTCRASVGSVHVRVVLRPSHQRGGEPDGIGVHPHEDPRGSTPTTTRP